MSLGSMVLDVERWKCNG